MPTVEEKERFSRAAKKDGLGCTIMGILTAISFSIAGFLINDIVGFIVIGTSCAVASVTYLISGIGNLKKAGGWQNEL